jgi:hypothetical protein
VKSLNDEVYLKGLIRGVCQMNLAMAGQEAADIRGETCSVSTKEEKVVMKVERAVECNILPDNLEKPLSKNPIQCYEQPPASNPEDPHLPDHPYAQFFSQIHDSLASHPTYPLTSLLASTTDTLATQYLATLYHGLHVSFP